MGIGRRNAGWLQVLGMVGVGAVWWDDRSMMLGRMRVGARWSLWLLLNVVMVAYVG